jgi:MraZ protein
MFLGRYQHTIDDKGRLIIPVRYREILERGAFVTQGFERNLMVLTADGFDQLYANVNRMSLTDPSARDLKRFIFSTAERVEVDKIGRILLPQYLRNLAQLESEVILVGVGDYFEIWSPSLWAQKNEQLEDVEANEKRFAVFDLSTH